MRAWDKINKCMCYEGYYIGLDGEVISGITERVVLDWYDHFILMRKTGLKDRNDVPIFEGDVIKIDTDEDFPVRDIVFHEGSFSTRHCYLVSEHQFTHYTPLKDYTRYPIYLCEVIGNIHQTPTLIAEPCEIEVT